MSVVEIPPKENSSVNGRLRELIFLISTLDQEEKREFVQEFSDDFKGLIESGLLSRTGYKKLVDDGLTPSDERVLQVAIANKDARRWIINKAKEKAEKVLKIIEAMGEKDE